MAGPSFKGFQQPQSFITKLYRAAVSSNTGVNISEKKRSSSPGHRSATARNASSKPGLCREPEVVKKDLMPAVQPDCQNPWVPDV